MRVLMLVSFLPAAMAAFDKCARQNGEWAGFDQVIILPRCAEAFTRLRPAYHRASRRPSEARMLTSGGALWQPYLCRRTRVRRALCLPRHGWAPAQFRNAAPVVFVALSEEQLCHRPKCVFCVAPATERLNA